MQLPQTRRIAIALAAVVAAGTLGWGGTSTTAGAATANFTCKGIEGDQAGEVSGAKKSSKELLGLLATLGGSAELALPVDVSVTAPSSVKTGSGAYDVGFAYKISLPDSLVKSAKDLLKVTTLKVENASFGIDLSGAATGTVTGTTSSIDVTLGASPVTVQQAITGKVTPTSSGLVYYRPGATKLSVVVNGEVSGVAKIGTITVACTATGLLGSTAVRPPGSPVITPNPIVVPAAAGSNTSVDLDNGGRVTPDEGNPITWTSLKLVGTATGGTASLTDRVLNFTAPTANGNYDVTFEVCGAPRTVKGSAGVNEVQTFTFADLAYSRDFPNVHPLFFTLKFGGQETAPIVTSFVDVDFFGNVTTFPFVPGDDASRALNILGGRFAPPSAATIQAALEALPNIEPGDVTVSGGPASATDLSAPYVLTFGKALGTADVGQVSVGQWNTWLPSEGLDVVLAAAGGISAGSGAVPPTVEESFNQLVAQTITADQFWTQFWARVQYDVIQGIDIQGILDFITGLFPKQPVTGTSTTGESPIADSSTGPLCSQGVVQFVVTGGGSAPVVAGTNVTAGTQARGATRVASTPTFAG